MHPHGHNYAMTTPTHEHIEALSEELSAAEALLEHQQLDDIDWALNAAKSNTIRSSSPNTGYSASVEMFLDINGVRHDVSHMGPEFIILAQPVNHPPCEGVVGLTIDGRLRQWPVQLPDGICQAVSRVRTAKAA
jgi:hypothetical protein